MKFFKNKKGFTLVELVVVIAILGILAGIAIPRFMDATATARGSKIVADLRTIDSAVMMYQAKNGSAPSAISDLTTSTNNFLASTPVPPTGEAIVSNNTGTSGAAKQIKIKSGLASAYEITNARGTYANWTADAIMNATADISAAK